MVHPRPAVSDRLLLPQGAKKPAAKNLNEEDKSGPVFVLVPNAKEQRVKEEKQLKVGRSARSSSLAGGGACLQLT